jgi:methionine S-methyltransferase
MGSVAAAVHEFPDSSTTALFLERCAASGDAAYGELRELLARLNDPATRKEARVFLAALGRISVDGDGGADEFFRRYGFCVRELLLHDSHCGLPITTLSSGTIQYSSSWSSLERFKP